MKYAGLEITKIIESWLFHCCVSVGEYFTSPNGMILYCIQEWNINRLSYEYDSEPFGKERDAAIKKLANEAGVEVIVRISHTLYDLDK